MNDNNTNATNPDANTHDTDQQHKPATQADTPTEETADENTTTDRPSSPVANRGEFQRRAPERPENPRRVRGGIKLSAESWPIDLGPFAAPIANLVDALVPPSVRDEAFTDYAKRGQTRTLTFENARIEASIQGRRYRAYTVNVKFRPHPAEAWDRVVSAMDDRPLLPAKLLAGEMPHDLLGFMSGLGVPLLPTPADVSRTTDSKEAGNFDKHAACVLMLAAEAIENDPFLLFQLRGLPAGDLAERLRQRRAVTSSTTGAAAAYDPQPLPEAEHAERPLEASLENFWRAGPTLSKAEPPIKRPEVTHPILRRLGPSPFEEGKFPLVGLLATCYDEISADALRDPEAEAAEADAASQAAPQPVPNESPEATESTSPTPDPARRAAKPKARAKAKAKAKKKA